MALKMAMATTIVIVNFDVGFLLLLLFLDLLVFTGMIIFHYKEFLKLYKDRNDAFLLD